MLSFEIITERKSIRELAKPKSPAKWPLTTECSEHHECMSDDEPVLAALQN